MTKHVQDLMSSNMELWRGVWPVWQFSELAKISQYGYMRVMGRNNITDHD